MLVVGELCADIIVSLSTPPVFDQTEHLVSSTAIVLGSSSAITACGAARLGVPTSFVGVAGDDLLGSFVVSELRMLGVDVSGCTVTADPTGSSTILTLPGGDRTILTALGSIGAVSVSDVPAALLSACAHVHVGSYFMQAGLWDHLAAFLTRCRGLGLTTSVDPNYDPSGCWDRGIGEVLGHVDVLFCNETELNAMAAAAGFSDPLVWCASEAAGSTRLVLKSGVDGASLWGAGDGRMVRLGSCGPPSLAGEVVDTVGAGDSLAAGFLAARLKGLGDMQALRVGVACGTASTRHSGGTAGQLAWEQAVEMLG